MSTGWMSAVLLAVAVYSVLWGGFVVLFPFAVVRLVGMELPNYPQIWWRTGIYSVRHSAVPSTRCAAGL
ncbi:MAG: hypothetical protein M3266_00460 [Actinomycetota bacterium]|nr:hypothetical protein [Actinomycetota bacterium]